MLDKPLLLLLVAVCWAGLVAVVVAQTRALAVDASELVDVDYEPLETLIDPAKALDDDAPRLFPDYEGGNLAAAGHSVVLVTHKLAEALDYADRITVMRGGKVVRTLLPAEVSEAELTALIVGSAVDECMRKVEVAVVVDADLGCDEAGRPRPDVS